VPALSGLGTPQWTSARAAILRDHPWIDEGARGARGARGIAQRGADLVDAAYQETGQSLEEIRVDGGMSDNRFLVQCLADFTGLRVAVSSEREATTRGAGLMALVGTGRSRSTTSKDSGRRQWC